MFGSNRSSQNQTAPIGGPALADHADVNTVGIFGALWRNRWWIIVPVVIAAVVSLAFVLTATPRYKASAQVLIERQETSFTRPEGEANAGNPQFDQEAIASEVQVIKSVDIAKRVIREQKLADLEEFNPGPGIPGMLNLVRRLLGGGGEGEVNPEQILLSKFRKHLEVYALSESRVITIEFWSEDPELATRITNAVTDAYIDFQKAAVVETTTEASTWLERQIADLRSRVSNAEQRVENFRAENNLFNSSSGTGATDNRPATLMSQELTELSSQLTQARAQRSDAQARARMINQLLDTGRSIESRDVFDSAIILRLQEERARVGAQIAELSSTLLPAHPRMLELSAQRQNIGSQIRTEAERIVRGLENDAAVAAAREQQIMLSLDALKQNAANSSEAEVQLRALEREANAQRQLLESYLTRFREAVGRTATELTPSRARIISRATVPLTPFYPSKKLIPALAVTGTLVLASAVVLTLEMARLYAMQPVAAMGYGAPMQPAPVSMAGYDPHRREPSLEPEEIFDPAEPDNDTGSPIVARGSSDLGRHQADHDDPVQVPQTVQARSAGRPIQNAFSTKVVESDLPVPASGTPQNWQPEPGERLIMIGGLTRSEPGMDALVSRLRDMADEGQQILCIDLRPGAPLVLNATGKTKLPGFHDILHGQSSFEEAIFGDTLSRMNIMGGGQAVLVANLSNVEPMFEALTTAYDLVVVIAAPFNRVPWQIGLAQSCDLVALVGGRGDTNAPELKRLVKRLEQGGRTRVERHIDGVIEVAA